MPTNTNVIQKAFGKRDLQHIEKIKASGSNTNLVKIKYRDKKGNISQRYVEPYKLDGEDFWAYDPNKGGIRRFKIRNVRSVMPTNQNYKPRWDIEMDKAAMYKDYIYKIAKLNEDVHLYPHQERAVKKPSGSVIYAHGVGSGKTLTGIARFEYLKSQGKANKALVVVPAGLRDNFANQGVKKFTDSKANIIGNKSEISNGQYGNVDPNADYNVISYEMFRSNPVKYIKESGADTVITDESHRGKNESTKTTNALKSTRGMYQNYIGLTGSLVSNEIADVLPLVDVASNGNHKLGKNKAEFTSKYIKRSKDGKYKGTPEKRVPIVGFKNKKELVNTLSKYIDYLDVDDVRDVAQIPKENLNVVKVPIDKKQAKMYKALLRDDRAVKKMITSKRLETYKDEEIARAYNKMIEARKLMNSVGSVHPNISLSESAKITPKTKKLLDDMQAHIENTPDGKALLFSNLINGGTDVLEAGLKDRNIDYGKFIGKGNEGVTEESRQRDVNDYNNGKKKVMVISGAGGEGISLGDTTWEGVLDPHYNPERMKQMEARGIRSHGLSHRKPEDRVVDVNRYMATMPNTLKVFKSRYRTPDEFIYEVAQNKGKQNQLLYDTLKKNRKKESSMDYESEIYKKASDYEEEIYKIAEDQFMYHASRVQGIKRFRRSEDTSGNNKGKVIFASKDPSFAAAFGAKWNDGNARFVVETANKQVPDKENYEGTCLEYTDDVNLDAPCSMYKLKGNFKPLRYDNDIEHYTDKDVDIISEEQFKSFRDMAKHYNVALKKVSDGHIMNLLKSKKSSNFEKKATEYEEEIHKIANDLTTIQRKQLPDEIFGFPEQRKFPMPDKEHVVKAWQFLGRSKLSDAQKSQVKDRILSRAKELGVDTSGWNTEKTASSSDDLVNKDGKILSIENAFADNIDRKVATMMATSHEYKTPNVDGALAMTKNYKWEKSTEKINNLQGINKPIKCDKVFAIAEGIKKDHGKVDPFIIVNQMDGIRPQTPGKKILLDGHHRMEACKLLGKEEVPVYKGTYTGGAQKDKEELREKVAFYKRQIMEL
jgi:hypothetical protein